jgi:glycerol uptake facilitator-like aquaporin
MARVEHGQIVETATEARGGVPGKPVLYMLVAGTTGVIVAFAVVYLIFFSH